MEDYTHYRFHPERRRMQVDSLKPPLKLLEDWSMSGVACQPKIKEGKVFVSLLSSGLKVFEQSTATELWSFSPKGIDDDLSGEGDVLISGDTLVTRRGGKIFVLDSSTGELRGSQSTPAFDLASAALRGNVLYGIYLDEEDADEPIYCFAYDLERADFLWRHRILRPPKVLTMSEQQIFISDNRGSFTCLSAETGSEIWRNSLKEIGKFTDIDQTIRSGDVTGIPLLWGNMVIVPVEGYHVLAFNQASGEIDWSQRIDIDDPRSVVCSPEGILIVVDCEICINLDVTSGRILSQMNIDAAVRSQGGPLLTQSDVTNGYLYFSTINKGILVALDRQSGEIPWSFKCAAPVPIANAPVVVDGRLYLVDESHNLYVFKSG